MTKNNTQPSFIASADLSVLDAAKNVPEDMAQSFALVIASEFDNRAAYEAERKNDEKAPIVGKLNKLRAKLALPSLASVLLAIEVEPTFINDTKQTVDDADRFNVYAIDKVIDLLNALAGKGLRNQHNIHILRSILNFRREGLAFDGEHAKAASSKAYRLKDPSHQRHLTRYTVSASTAPTQSNSTLAALQVLGIVKNTGTKRAGVYQMAETPQAKAIEQLLTAA